MLPDTARPSRLTSLRRVSPPVCSSRRPRLTSLAQLAEDVQREMILAALEPILDGPSVDERWAMLRNQRVFTRPAGRLPDVARASTPCPPSSVAVDKARRADALSSFLSVHRHSTA